MRELDVKDREILEILSKEARVALKALAARIGLSRSATSERVLHLERSGIIRGYRADIGEIDANVIRAIILVSLKRTPALGLLDLLAQNAQVKRVSSVSGQLDLVVEVEARTIDDLNRVRDAVACHDSVDDITTAVVLRRKFASNVLHFASLRALNASLIAIASSCGMLSCTSCVHWPPPATMRPLYIHTNPNP